MSHCIAKGTLQIHILIFWISITYMYVLLTSLGCWFLLLFPWMSSADLDTFYQGEGGGSEPQTLNFNKQKKKEAK